MRRTFLWLIVFPAVAVADPIPKESESARLKRVWGELVDTGGGTKVKLEGDKLKLTIPAGDRLVFPMRGGTPTFAPYLYQTVTGDFVAQVTLVRHSAPPETSYDGGNAITASGLVAIFDSQTVFSYSRGIHNNGEPRFRSTFRYRGGSSTTTGGGNPKFNKQESCTLRLTRAGDQLKMEYSFDDAKTWQNLTTTTRATNAEVKIGIYAEHACDAVTEATFEGFSVMALNK